MSSHPLLVHSPDPAEARSRWPPSRAPPLTTSPPPFPPPLPFNSEALSEDSAFQSRQLASLVASKVYFHLGNLDEALAFALGAGSLFDVELAGDVAPQEAQYVETIICTCSLTSFQHSPMAAS